MFNSLFLAKSIIEKFEPMDFIEHLKYMFSGMIAIFIVIGVIIIATSLINKIFSKKK